MSKDNNNDKQPNIGEELFIEAAAALFEDPEKIAELLSPEEAAEFEELRRRAMGTAGIGYTTYSDDVPIAAEESNNDNYK